MEAVPRLPRKSLLASLAPPSSLPLWRLSSPVPLPHGPAFHGSSVLQQEVQGEHVGAHEARAHSPQVSVRAGGVNSFLP